jgi:hypothetical protein
MVGKMTRQAQKKVEVVEEQTLCRSVAVPRCFSFLVEVRKDW